MQQNLDVTIKGGMTASLPTDFNSAKTNFDTQHQPMEMPKKKAATGTKDAIEANKAL